jgi:hypothetical protein
MAHACGDNKARRRLEKILLRSARTHLILSTNPSSPKTLSLALVLATIAKANAITDFVAIANDQGV